MIQCILEMCFDIVDFDPIDCGRNWVKHSVLTTLVAALDKDHLSFELLAVVTKVQSIIVVAIFW